MLQLLEFVPRQLESGRWGKSVEAVLIRTELLEFRKVDDKRAMLPTVAKSTLPFCPGDCRRRLAVGSVRGAAVKVPDPKPPPHRPNMDRELVVPDL
jgi:hypothetical protein